MSGPEGVRQVIHDAIASYQGIDGLGPDWLDDGEEIGLITTLVLDALGLEQVGWTCGPGNYTERPPLFEPEKWQPAYRVTTATARGSEHG